MVFICRGYVSNHFVLPGCDVDMNVLQCVLVVVG